MTAEHFMIGDRVTSVDGRYDGVVEARDSYGWPIVAIRNADLSRGGSMFLDGERARWDGGAVRLYEHPGFWRVVA